MSITSLPTALATASLASLALLCAAGESHAQATDEGLYCYDAGLDRTVSLRTPPAGFDGVCDGSVNKVFSSNALAGVSDYALIEAAVGLCGLPNGPYKRATPGQPLDYIVSTPANPSSTNPITISPGEMAAQISGLTPGEGPLTFALTAVGNPPSISVTQTTPAITVESEILDLPGYEFLQITPSSGKGNPQIGWLMCDVKMWGRTSSGTLFYGVRNFTPGIGVNTVAVGLAAGPSGAVTKANATTLCNAANFSAAALEKQVSYSLGNYKLTAENSVNPINATGCLDGSTDLTANYCDPTEAAGQPDNDASPPNPNSRPNSCNPDGETGGTIVASDTGLVNGAASHICTSGRLTGTSTCFKH